MNNKQDLDKDAIAYFFQLSNKMQKVFDQLLKYDDLTIKQLFLMIVIDSFDEVPNYSQVSKRFGTSHQNVKQIALKLKKNGFLKIKKDPNDSRFRLLQLSQKAKRYWQNRDKDDALLLQSIFFGISKDRMVEFIRLLQDINNNINALEKGEKS
ncbi:MAG: MarR family winged helix-turn-helix transcriptional regulator [Candidatus Izemoplasma sp.]|nr:MarR family winged helix-turn-helix transcriptional regulator [Candidatus Izemoplasma sp.]